MPTGVATFENRVVRDAARFQRLLLGERLGGRGFCHEEVSFQLFLRHLTLLPETQKVLQDTFDRLVFRRSVELESVAVHADGDRLPVDFLLEWRLSGLGFLLGDEFRFCIQFDLNKLRIRFGLN